MNGSRNTLFAIGKLLRQYAEHEPRFSEHQEQRDPGLSAPKSQLETLKQWIAVNTRMLGKAGFSSALLLPVMAKAAADQLQSDKLQAFVSVESLEAEGATLSESAGTITLPDGTVINLDQATLVNIGGEQYVLLDTQSVPEGALTGTTSQGNPSLLIRPESLEGVSSAVVEADDAITLIMTDGSSTTILGENVVVAGGNAYLLPEGLDAVGGGALEATATSAATEYPLSTILLGGLGAIGLAVGLSGGGGGGSATPPPEEPDTTAPDAPTVSLANDTGTDDEDSVTNDATLTITAEAGATVEVFNDETLLGEADEDADNPGTFSFVRELSDGEYSLTVVATDAAGNESEPSEPVVFALDTTAPEALTVMLAEDTGASNEDGITSKGEVTVEGLQPDAVWEYSVDGGDTWQAGEGSAFTLAEGVYADGDVQVRQSDAAGNVSEATNLGPVTVDVTVESPIVTLATDAGTSDSDGLTNDATLTITTEAGATVEVFNGDTSLGQAVEDADNPGTFTFVPEDLPEGNYSFTAVTTDPAGNQSQPSDALTVTLDTTVPNPPIVGLTNDTGPLLDGITSDGTLVIRTEPGSVVDVFTDTAPLGQATEDPAVPGRYTLETDLEDGEYTITAIANDPAGNASFGQTTITLDTSAPDAPELALANNTGDPGDNLTGDPSLAITAEAGSRVEVFNGTDSLGIASEDPGNPGQFSFTPDLAAGEYTLSAVSTDLAGNESTVSAGLSFELDSSSPVVALANDTGASDTDRVTSDIELRITAEAGSTVTVSNADGVLGDADETATPGVFTFTPDGLADGQYSFTAVADNGTPSEPSQPLAVTLDTTAPDPLTVALSEDTGTANDDRVTTNGEVTISGLEEGASWEYSVDGGLNWLNPEPGSVSFTVEPGQYGTGTVLARQIDVAGNTGDPGALGAFEVDQVAPDAPALALASDTGTSATDGLTSDSTLSITAEAGSTVEVFNGETSLGLAQEDPDNAGTFTFEPTGLADGSYTLTATATDAAGNTSAVSPGIAVTLDTAASTPTVSLANDTGVSGSDGVTSDGALAVSGLEAGATWEYSVDGGENWVEGNGTGFSLDEGDYADGDVQVRQIDAAGNVSTAGSLGTVTVDQTLPEVVIDATALNNLELGQTESVTFSFSEAPYQFTATDITLPESLALSSLSVVAGTNGQTYRADVSVIRNTGITDGVVSVGTGISDLAGNSPLAAFSSQPFSVVQADPLIVGGVDAQFETVEQALAVSAGNETLLLQDSSFNLTTLANDQEAVFRNLSDVEMNSGSRLTLPADLATATTITAADTASVVITGLDDQDYDFSAITVADGKVATTVNQDVSLNTNTDLGSLLIGVNQGATLTLTAAQADARIISGEGGVQITALEATPDADLSAITATGNVEANFNAGTGTDVTFTGQLGGAEVSVTSGNLSLEAGASTDAAGFAVAEGASLTGSAAQLDGLTITGSGGVSVTDLAENTDLSGFADALDVTASVNQSLDLRSNPDLSAVDAYQVAAGATLTLTAAQANGLTISGDGNLIISNLSETPDADLSGITANTEVQVTSSVEFTGNAGDPASVAFTVEEGRTLALDSGAVDGRTIEGSGTLAVTGTVDATGDGSAALDVSNLTVNGVDLTGATLDPDISDLTLASSSVFTLLPEQAEQLTLTGNEETNSLTIDVSGLFAGGETSADLAVDVSTLGGNDTLRFNFGPGEDNRQLNLTGSINLGDGTNVLEISNGVVSIAGLTDYSGVTIVQINSTLVLSADQFSDQLADLENNPDSALRGAGSIEVTGTLSDGKAPIDLNLLGNFEPGGATPPTVAFPAGFVEGTDFILPTNTESLLTVTVGGVEDDIFNGDYTPVEVTAFTASQLTGALGIGTVETIKLANSITLNQSLDTSASNVTFDFTAGALNLEPGVGLTLSAAQADGARVSGEGSLTISGATGDFSADLSRVSADTVNIVVAGGETLDVTGTTNLANASVTVPAGATLVVNASQASGLNLSGDGAVTILLDSLSANLTGVGAGTGLDLTTVVDASTPPGQFTGRFGDSAVEIGAGQTLVTSAVNIDGRSVSGEGNITLVNPGSLSDRQLDLSGVENTGNQILEVTNSVPVLGGDLGTFSVSVSANATFSSTAALLDGVSVTGEGNVRIGGLDAANVDADFGALAVTGDVEIDVAESITRTLPLPDGALVTVPAGATLTLSPDVLADLVIFGNGNLALTVDQDEAAVDLSLVLVEGDTTVSIAEGVTVDLSGATLADAAIELAAGANATLSAAQLDGRSVTGDGSLEIIGLDEAPDADFSGIANTIARVQDIPTITVNDLTADNVVNAGEAQAGVEVTGTVTNAEASPLEGLEVTVTLGETEFTATTDAQGQWSVTLPQNRLTDQGNGETSLTASVTNASGNSGSFEQTFTIDLAPPAAPTLALAEDTGAENSDAITSNGTVTVGNLQTGASWEYSVDGGENWITGEGNSFELEEGSYPQGTLLARQTSDTGNTSVAGDLGAVSVDSTSPAAPTLALAVDSGVDGDGISNDDTLTINAEQGSVVTVFNGTENLGTATEQAPGVYSFSPGLEDGTYNLTATATDVAGNTSDAGSISFTLATSAPPAPTVALVADSGVGGDNITNNPELRISTRENSVVEVFNGEELLGEATPVEGSPGFYEFTPELADGSYSLSVITTDSRGNASPAEQISVQLDTQVPDAPTLELVNDTSVPGDNITSDLTLAISAEAGSTVEVFNGTTSLGFATAEGDGFVFTPDNLPDGDYTLTARATDVAGNTSAASAPLEATLQPDVDTVTNEDLGVSYSSLTEAVAAASEGHTLTLSSGTYTENVVIDKALTINGANAGEAPVDAEGNPLPDLADGVRTNDESWINGKLTIAAANVVIDGVRLHNPDGPLDWDESLLTQGGGGLDGFQLLNSYLTGYTGNGAPRFNGDGDYVGEPVASNWVIENNLIGGMIDGAGGALYLSGLADSSISDNVFWRPAAGHLYVSSLQNTAVEDNQFYHGVHAGGADFDGLAEALLEANGFGYGDVNTDGPDGYGADGYGGTYFGRNFWIEVKGTNSDVSITGNTGQYNSGGIQLYGEGNEAYSFADFTISNNVFEDFINADPTGVLDGTGRSVSGFNGAINVSVLNDSQATNLVVTNNTITAAADQVYSARDFFSLINIQGKVTDLTVTGNTAAWGESSQAVTDALDALGLSLADYEGQLQGIALTGGIAGEAVITGNTLGTDITATTPDDGFVGIVIRNDVGSVVDGIGFYTALTTVDESNTFQLDNPAGVPLGLIGFTESQLEALFDLGLLNEADIVAPAVDAPLEPDFQTVVAEALQLQVGQDFELVDRYAVQELPAGGWLVRADVLETQDFPIGYEHWFLLDEQGGVLADQAFNTGEGVFMRSLGSADSNAVYVQQVTVTGNPGADPLNVTQDQPPTIHSVDITNVAALANLLGNSGGESLTSADNLAESWTASEISGGQLDTLDTNQILIAEGYLPGVEGKNTAVFALEDLAQDQVLASWVVSDDGAGAVTSAVVPGNVDDPFYSADVDPQGIYLQSDVGTPDGSRLAARFDIATGDIRPVPESLVQALGSDTPLEATSNEGGFTSLIPEDFQGIGEGFPDGVMAMAFDGWLVSPNDNATFQLARLSTLSADGTAGKAFVTLSGEGDQRQVADALFTEERFIDGDEAIEFNDQGQIDFVEVTGITINGTQLTAQPYELTGEGITPAAGNLQLTLPSSVDDFGLSDLGSYDLFIGQTLETDNDDVAALYFRTFDPLVDPQEQPQVELRAVMMDVIAGEAIGNGFDSLAYRATPPFDSTGFVAYDATAIGGTEPVSVIYAGLDGTLAENTFTRDALLAGLPDPQQGGDAINTEALSTRVLDYNQATGEFIFALREFTDNTFSEFAYRTHLVSMAPATQGSEELVAQNSITLEGVTFSGSFNGFEMLSTNDSIDGDLYLKLNTLQGEILVEVDGDLNNARETSAENVELANGGNDTILVPFAVDQDGGPLELTNFSFGSEQQGGDSLDIADLPLDFASGLQVVTSFGDGDSLNADTGLLVFTTQPDEATTLAVEGALQQGQTLFVLADPSGLDDPDLAGVGVGLFRVEDQGQTSDLIANFSDLSAADLAGVSGSNFLDFEDPQQVTG